MAVERKHVVNRATIKTQKFVSKSQRTFQIRHFHLYLSQVSVPHPKYTGWSHWPRAPGLLYEPKEQPCLPQGRCNSHVAPMCKGEEHMFQDTKQRLQQPDVSQKAAFPCLLTAADSRVGVNDQAADQENS